MTCEHGPHQPHKLPWGDFTMLADGSKYHLRSAVVAAIIHAWVDYSDTDVDGGVSERDLEITEYASNSFQGLYAELDTPTYERVQRVIRQAADYMHTNNYASGPDQMYAEASMVLGAEGGLVLDCLTDSIR